MKTYRFLPLLLSAGAVFAGSLNLNAATSDPVGAMSISIKGSGGTTLLSAGGFTQPPSFVGQGDIPTSTTLDDSDASWTVDEFAGTHYVQLASGEWSAIISNSSTGLVLESAMSTGTDLSFKIIPFHTLSNLFGPTNNAGFTGGSNLGVSDIIAPWDAEAQNFAGFYYYNTTRTRWEDAGNTDASGVILYPDESIVVIGQADVNVTLYGSVQLNSTSGFISGGGNTTILPNPYPVDVEIGLSGLENSLNGASTFGSADWLAAWNPATQTFTKFYYYDTDDNTWKDAGNVAVTASDVIPSGYAIVIIKNSSGDVDWFIDQPFNL